MIQESCLWLSIIFSMLLYFLSGTCKAASADEVLVVVNKRMSGAMEISRYYMQMRKIPEDHLLITSLSLTETMERDEYEKKLMLPVRKKITELKSSAKIYAIVLIYGVPLKVLPPELDWTFEELLHDLKKQEKKLRKETEQSATKGELIKELTDKINSLAGADKRASVDSELMLVKVKEYSLSNWIENPYFIGFQGKSNSLRKDDILLVSRIDGPDEKTVYRLIDDAIAAEKTGLNGIAYFDARWPLPKDPKHLSGYAQWDASLHRAADVVKKRMKVTLNDKPELFAEGAAPNAALYSGWYSLGKYVDSFKWVRGSVGYHIASAECTTLRKQDSAVWCLQMLKRGVTATIGPVYEPYVQGFPLPEIFFGAFTEGYMNLGESYLISLPYISWQMVLVGDPLYHPFSPLPQGKNEIIHQ